MATFLTNWIFKDLVLPFVLIFTLIFAVLEKSKLLDEGKQQINAIIAFVIAAILVTFSTQVEWIQKFSVFLAVALFVYFVFMLIWGFTFGVTKGDPFEGLKNMKNLLGAIAFIAVVIAVLVITGWWTKVVDFFTSGDKGANIIMIVVIVGAIAAVLWKKGGSSEEKK